MDSSIIHCECGSKVRLPAGERKRSFRCPSCKVTLALTADATVLSAETLSAGQEAICPICQTAIEGKERCVTCPGCDQIHHGECWSEMGGCATYGCVEAPVIEESESSAGAPLTAWGDTKKCPACGEEIKSIALRCRYCETAFSSVDPMSTGDLRMRAVTGDELDSLKKTVVGLFILSLLGCMAPLMAIVSMGYLLPRREKLAKCSPIFVIMGWTSIVLSSLYTVLLIVFFLSSEL